MNLFFNFNNLDTWFKDNYSFNKQDLFLKNENNDFKLLLDETIKNNNISESKINSINVVISLNSTDPITPTNIWKFGEFNKEWNVKFIESIQPLITFCRLHNKLFNIIYIYLDQGSKNIANIAMAQLLKSLVIGLNQETKPFKFKSKLFVLDKEKKEYLSKLNKLLSSKRKVIISNSKLLQQLKFSWIRKNLHYV